ncbi:hypothetical protein MKX01_007911 [Papaver californicum]|nr:hypothetical protein MKX01_007911 [Papaver californicum]
MDDDDACPAKYPIPDFKYALLTYAPDVEQLNLYFDCSEINILVQFKFNCQINDTCSGRTPSSDAYFWFDLVTHTLGFILEFSSCSKAVKVPVMSAFLGELIAKQETLPTVLKQGFNVTCYHCKWKQHRHVFNLQMFGRSMRIQQYNKIPNLFSWDVSKVHIAWFADEEKVCKATGLPENSVVPIQNLKELNCGICFKAYPRDTMYAAACGHHFCSACWPEK